VFRVLIGNAVLLFYRAPPVFTVCSVVEGFCTVPRPLKEMLWCCIICIMATDMLAVPEGASSCPLFSSVCRLVYGITTVSCRVYGTMCTALFTLCIQHSKRPLSQPPTRAETSSLPLPTTSEEA
jgi:hypothetical protein